MKQEFKKMGEVYENTNSYSFQTTHKSFRGHNSKTAFEIHQGDYIKKDKQYRSSLLGVETVQNKEFKVALVKESKQILIYDLDEKLRGKVDPADFKGEIANAKEIKKGKLGVNTYFTITYKPNLPIERLELELDKNGFILKIAMYYSELHEWTDNQGKKQVSKAKLEIEYKNIKLNIAVQDSEFNTSEYVIKSTNGYISSMHYRNYIVEDLRILKQK